MLQLMSKSSAAVVAVIILLLFSCTEGQYPSSDQALIGLECSPPFGYLRNLCGPEIQIEETAVPSPLYLHGPNTCRITKISQRNELEYAYKERCDYYLTPSGYHYTYVWSCQVVCQPTYTCSRRNQTIERSNFECCPGFQVRPAESSSHYEYMFLLYYTRARALPVGCPRAVGENNVTECLDLLQLTEFFNYADASDIFQMLLLNAGGSEFTLFAPTNAAFAAFEALPEELEMNLDTLVGHHIVQRTIAESDLAFDVRFNTFSNTTLHSTVVVYGDRTLTYNPQYSHRSRIIRYSEVPFVSGARIVNADACITEGVTLHVIDRVLIPPGGMAGMQTIADFLQSSSNFTIFTEALRFANVLSFLGNEDVSRTVFVPNDETFSAQIPDDLLRCLMYMRLPLSDLVLYHITRGAEYTTSLSLREFRHTLLLGQATRLTTSSEGVITFNNNDPPSSIVVPNIAASNGVIHIIDNVLIPPNLDFGMCLEFVPTTPPTTPPPPTTEPVTTVAATTMDLTTPTEVTTPPDVTSGATALAPGGVDTPDLSRNI